VRGKASKITHTQYEKVLRGFKQKLQLKHEMENIEKLHIMR